MMRTPSLRHLGWVVVVVVLALGCTHTYVPRQARIKLGKIPALNDTVIAQAVAVHAAPGSEVAKMIAARGNDQWIASPLSLNQMVAQHIVTELEKRKVAIDPGAERRLEVSVEHPWLTQGSMGASRCTVDVIVVTGDGRSFNRLGEKTSLSSPDQCFDQALAHGAIAVLSDAEILAYLRD